MGLKVLTLDDLDLEQEQAPVGVCPACKGMGMVRRDLPVQHPDFGKLALCENEFHEQERYARLVSMSGLKAHERHRLTAIKKLDKDAAALVSTVRQFLKGNRGWLYLWGGPGTAKSLALMAAVHEFILLGREAYYSTLADLLDVIRDAFTEPAKRRTDDEDGWRRYDTYQSRFQRLCRVALLALDEFDPEKVKETEWVNQFRFQLMDQRYRDALGKQTVTMFAGNLDPQSTLPPWMWDRIEDGRFKVFHHPGASARSQMAWWQENI